MSDLNYLSSKESSVVDSAENMCDELVERILGYLPLTDKFRFEGVSKQWQRVIYNQQTILRVQTVEPALKHTISELLLQPISDTNSTTGLAHSHGLKQLRKPEFETVLKKCKFIRCLILRCYIDDYDLSLIGKYLDHLEELQVCMYGISEKGLTEFGSVCGMRLKNLHLHNIEHNNKVVIKNALNYCEKIELLCFQNVNAFIREAKEFLPKLESVPHLNLDSRHIESIRLLTEKYSNQIKTLGLVFNDLTAEEGKTILSYVESLEHLQLFKVEMKSCDNSIKPIDQNLIRLSKKCTKLKCLELVVRQENWVTTNILNAFENFSSLLTLRIYFSLFEKPLECSCECFRMCAKLKYLKVWCIDIGDRFFDDIGHRLSTLQRIEINTLKALTDNCLISLSKLSKLRQLFLRMSGAANKYMTDTGVCQLIDSCCDIEMIWFGARPKITVKTVDFLIDIAAKRERNLIRFYCGLSRTKDELQFEPIDVIRLQNLPHNLQINIA